MELFSIVLLIVGSFGLGILGKYLRDRKLTRIHEMIHLERMKAMEKDIPLQDLGHEQIVQDLSKLYDVGERNNGSGAGIVWLRIYALCLGLIFFCGGLGTLAAFRWILDQDASQFWTLGFIPVLIGVGLLLFCALTRGLAERRS